MMNFIGIWLVWEWGCTKKATYTKLLLVIKMVGMTGFEPATPWSQTKCSTKLSHIPINGALEGIRTPDLLVRSQTLYPAELRAHDFDSINHLIKWWLQRESNQRHRYFQSLALPTEL